MNIDELARKQLSDYDAHCPGKMFQNGSAFLTVTQAYELQNQVTLLRIQRGEGLAGYKIGCLSEAVRQQFGLQTPVLGAVFASEMHGTGSLLDPAFFDGMAIEGEFAFRVRQEIPNSEWVRKNPSEAIESSMAVIELHNYVFRSHPPTAQELIANNALHAGVVLPANEITGLAPQDLLVEEIAVLRNRQTLGIASGSAMPGGPLESLVKVAEMLERFGKRLEPGQIVLTGSPLPLYRVSPGDHIEVTCGNLNPVEVTIGQR